MKEKRGEAFVNLGRQLNPNLRIDAGMRFEYSHLTVTGDASADRKLKFWKPSATIDWKPGGGWHTQFSVKRTVAQLNFFDFVTVAELSADRVNAGNSNLQPQRAWEFRFTADHPLFGDGLVKLDLGYDHISMLQDRVLICDEIEPLKCFDAPGNIGTGKHLFATLNIDAPLGQFWKGLRVKFNGTVRRTRVEDPIDGEQRNFSDFYPNWQWNLDVRRDAGSWSYGFSLFDRARFTFFRTTEFDVNYNGEPGGNAFVEYRPDARTSLTLDVQHIFGKRNREIYVPNRLNTSFVLNEYRERDRHHDFGLTLKRSFGGNAAQPAQ